MENQFRSKNGSGNVRSGSNRIRKNHNLYIEMPWSLVYRLILVQSLQISTAFRVHSNVYQLDVCQFLVHQRYQRVCGRYMYMALTETALLAKVISIFYYGKTAVELSKLMQDPVLSLKKQHEKDYFIIRHKTLSFMQKIYTCTALTFCCICFADPFFRPTWKLPFDAWMPFNWRSWSTFFMPSFTK